MSGLSSLELSFVSKSLLTRSRESLLTNNDSLCDAFSPDLASFDGLEIYGRSLISQAQDCAPIADIRNVRIASAGDWFWQKSTA